MAKGDSGMNWLKIVETLAPVILSVTVPGAGPALAGLVIQGIQSAEALKDAKGKDKLNHAMDIVTAGAQAVNAVRPGLIDPEALSTTVQSAVSTIVDAANLIHKGKQ